MSLEDLLQEFGCQVVEIASRVETALKSIKEGIFDVAVLNVNLKGETSYRPRMRSNSVKIQFLFATGCGIRVISEKYRQRAVVQKPFRKQDLEEALLRALQ